MFHRYLHALFQVDPQPVGSSSIFLEFSVWRYNFQVVAPSVLGTFFTTADIRSENFSYLPSDPDDWSTGSDWGVQTEPIPPAKKVSKKQRKKARDQRYKEKQKEFDINIALCVSFYAFLYPRVRLFTPIFIIGTL